MEKDIKKNGKRTSRMRLQSKNDEKDHPITSLSEF